MTGYGGYYLCRQNIGIAYAPMRESLGMSAIEFGWSWEFDVAKPSVGRSLVVFHSSSFEEG